MNRKLSFILIVFFSLFIAPLVQAKLLQVSKILKSIVAPTFPNHEFNVLEYGATNDGITDSRTAINKAITTCSFAGGGIVVIPKGKYYVAGSIFMKSNVNLNIAEGAEIIFSSKPRDYTPFVLTSWEGTELFNYSPLIYAYHVSNIALTGKGKICGSGSVEFAKWKTTRFKNQTQLRQMGIDQTPVLQRNFGKESILPPSMIQFFGCSNILVEDIRIEDSPFWIIHPVYCNNVIVRGVEITSYNPNNDGCDPESSRNILIENCTFNVGDDAVAIKAGRDQDGWRVGQPSENIVIRNCIFNSKCNGLCIGSEMSAGVQNVYMENIRIKHSLTAIYFKSNLDRGGFIRNIHVKNIKCDTITSALIRFETNYKGARGGNYPTIYKNFLIENVEAKTTTCECGIYAVGIKNYPLKDILLRNIYLKNCKMPYALRNVENIVFENVNINGIKQPQHPAETKDVLLKSF